MRAIIFFVFGAVGAGLWGFAWIMSRLLFSRPLGVASFLWTVFAAMLMPLFVELALWVVSRRTRKNSAA